MISELILIFVLILLNGLFSMAEIAIVSAKKARLEKQMQKGDKLAKYALIMANMPDKLLSTVQIGITSIGILNGIFSGAQITQNLTGFFLQYPIIAPYANTLAVSIVVACITYFTLVLGELVPKRIGLTHPETIAKYLARPMAVVSKIATPFVWLLMHSTHWVIKLLRINTTSDNQVTEEEIKALIEEGTSVGTIDEIEQDIVENVFHLGDRKVASLMTHKKDIVYLSMDETENEIWEKISKEPHSVYVVLEDDDFDKVLGIVYSKELFISHFKTKKLDIKANIKTVHFFPENVKSYQVLEKFKESKIYYGLVVDEYGNIQGMVTLNDIIDVLVGNVSEYDTPMITERENGTYLLDGQLPYQEFLQYFEIEEPNSDDAEFHTISGFALSILGNIPKTGETFAWKHFKFEIIDMDSNRIDKIMLTMEQKEVQ
ncbi:MAG: HlyC/CorC family transporter [Saprospiraceae bacterium]|jgi:putative hemolysin|nr:HlyC/CorC family transporter [Saprospiraceae bacterium]